MIDVRHLRKQFHEGARTVMKRARTRAQAEAAHDDLVAAITEAFAELDAKGNVWEEPPRPKKKAGKAKKGRSTEQREDSEPEPAAAGKAEADDGGGS